MHEECFDFVRRVKTAVPDSFTGKAVVEIGSKIWNDSVRPLFEDCRYVGVDCVEGEGVDVVANGKATPFADAEFDTGVCVEVFEHTPDWGPILAEIVRIVKPGGLIVVTAATTGRHAHGIDEYGFGHYENIAAAELRRRIAGTVLFFEEDYVACDVRAAWRSSGASSSPVSIRRRPRSHAVPSKRKNP